jgi:hypothetical protein
LVDIEETFGNDVDFVVAFLQDFALQLELQTQLVLPLQLNAGVFAAGGSF